MQRRQWMVAIGVLVGLAGCSGDPDEAALRARIDQLQSDGEQGRVAELMDAVADDFSGQQDSYDRQQLRMLLLAATRRFREIGVTRLDTRIEMRGVHASVDLKLLLTGGSGGLLPEQGRTLDLQTRWRVDGGRWQLIEASWDGDLAF
ncbi:MAG: hypothetical protein KDI51_11200 [Xanthomonadales bacterium]|nr:hypothetical protein [Xanthomonadales bacterium]